MALMDVATAHTYTFSFSVKTRATSSSPFYGIGLGLEGCEVAFSIDSFGKDCGPLKMAFWVSENM